MSAVVKQEAKSEIAASETSAILSMIERAARDPAVDIEKMERLFAMQERMLTRNAKAAYASALAEMQPTLPEIKHTGEIKHDKNKPPQSTYAKWEDIHEQIAPILAAHGFALSFRTAVAESRITVTAILSHREGHSEETSLPLPSDGSGSKNAVQAVGSSVSYGKRYTACAILNIRTRGEDDDGAGAAKRPADRSMGSANPPEQDGNGKGKSAYKAKKDGDWERVSDRLIAAMADFETQEAALVWWNDIVAYDEEYKSLPRSWRQMFKETEFEPRYEALPA